MKSTSKKVTEEDRIFFRDVITPALTKLQGDAKDWVPPEIPEYEGDPIDLTPEQEAELYLQIQKTRGHHDDSE